MHPRHVASTALAATAITAAMTLATSPALSLPSAIGSPPSSQSHGTNRAAPHDSTADVGQGISMSDALTDPDDTNGRIDLARISDRVAQLDDRHVIVSYRVRTYTTWGSQRLNATDRNFVLELNRAKRPGAERSVNITSENGVLVAQVVDNATNDVIATVAVTRPTDDSFVVTGPRSLIGARSYAWTSNFHAAHSYHCDEADGSEVTCRDDAPDHGWMRLSWPAWPGSRNAS